MTLECLYCFSIDHDSYFIEIMKLENVDAVTQQIFDLGYNGMKDIISIRKYLIQQTMFFIIFAIKRCLSSKDMKILQKRY